MRCWSDYSLSRRLDPVQLSALGTQTLSVFVNDSPGMTHGFRFFGDGSAIATSAVIDANTVQSVLDQAREAMRRVSWGTPTEYDQATDFDLHASTAPPVPLLKDLVPLAKAGFRIWDKLAGALAGGPAEADHLREVMRRPGTVQLGIRESSTSLLPLALLYDHKIDTQVQAFSSFTLCPTFSDTPATCFDGDCPNREEKRVVCPSGFWGYRHRIGVPIGTAGSPEAATTIPTAPVAILASAYAGKFELRDRHLSTLQEIVPAGRFSKKLTRKDTVASMKTDRFQILYFYCHGGVEDRSPFIVVGPDNEDPNRIARDTLRAENIRWTSQRPLVIINGCHTTALEPSQAIDLVTGFVETSHAAGVVGTEITLFEPLAAKMAEHMLRVLAEEKRDIGAALLEARRELLSGRSPNILGLVYVAFALSSLSLS